MAFKRSWVRFPSAPPYKSDIYIASAVSRVGNNADCELSVVAQELRQIDGYKTGIAVSTVILTPFQNESLAEFLLPQSRDTILKSTSSLYRVQSQWLNSGPPEKLQDICKQIIADFDARHLEESRKFIREIQDMVKGAK